MEFLTGTAIYPPDISATVTRQTLRRILAAAERGDMAECVAIAWIALARQPCDKTALACPRRRDSMSSI
jgi:hypothetical protein